MVDMPLVGEEFAGYRLVSVLGRGGMSTVFEAENPRLGNVIALKVLDPALAKLMPSHPDNEKVAHLIDYKWWADNIARVHRRFEQWLQS